MDLLNELCQKSMFLNTKSIQKSTAKLEQPGKVKIVKKDLRLDDIIS